MCQFKVRREAGIYTIYVEIYCTCSKGHDLRTHNPLGLCKLSRAEPRQKVNDYSRSALSTHQLESRVPEQQNKLCFNNCEDTMFDHTFNKTYLICV